MNNRHQKRANNGRYTTTPERPNRRLRNLDNQANKTTPQPQPEPVIEIGHIHIQDRPDYQEITQAPRDADINDIKNHLLANIGDGDVILPIIRDKETYRLGSNQEIATGYVILTNREIMLNGGLDRAINTLKTRLNEIQ